MRYAATWCLSPNIGDTLTPWLLKKLGLVDAAWVSPGATLEHLIVTGSVLNWSSKHSIAWGAGLASWKDEVYEKADVRAFRGPLSVMRARSCGWKPGPYPWAIGDPGLLVPKLVPAARAKASGLVGVVPHYTDMVRFAGTEDELAKHGIVVIDPFLPVEEFCGLLTTCERVMSSSLHGLILADAYDIPNLWVKLGDSIGGDGMKYWDYRASVGACLLDTPPTAADLRALPLSDVIKVAGDAHLFIPANPDVVKTMQRRLIETCPFMHASVFKELTK